MYNLQKDEYEISLWQDVLQPADTVNRILPYYKEEKVAIIGESNNNSEIMAFNPKLTSNIKGTNQLTFVMNGKYYDPYVGEMVDNPYVEFLRNEVTLKLRLKRPGMEEEFYDMIIKKCVEDSKNMHFTYTAEDKFIQELGKNGFKVELDDELENSQGTATELAERVLEATDWQVDTENSDIFVETMLDTMYEGKLKRDIAVRPAGKVSKESEEERYYVPDENLETDEIIGHNTTLIPADTRVLLFYSDLSEKEPNPMIILPKSLDQKISLVKNDNEDYYINAYNLLFCGEYIEDEEGDYGKVNNEYKKISELKNYNGTHYSLMYSDEAQGLPYDEEEDLPIPDFIKTENGLTLHTEARGQKVVRKQKSGYDADIDEYYLEYEKAESILIEETDFETAQKMGIVPYCKLANTSESNGQIVKTLPFIPRLYENSESWNTWLSLLQTDPDKKDTNDQLYKVFYYEDTEGQFVQYKISVLTADLDYIGQWQLFYRSRKKRNIRFYVTADGYNKIYRGYEKTHYVSPELAQNYLANSVNINGTDGWVSEGAPGNEPSLEVTSCLSSPTEDGMSTISGENGMLLMKLSNKDTYIPDTEGDWFETALSEEDADVEGIHVFDLKYWANDPRILELYGGPVFKTNDNTIVIYKHLGTNEYIIETGIFKLQQSLREKGKITIRQDGLETDYYLTEVTEAGGYLFRLHDLNEEINKNEVAGFLSDVQIPGKHLSELFVAPSRALQIVIKDFNKRVEVLFDTEHKPKMTELNEVTITFALNSHAPYIKDDDGQYYYARWELQGNNESEKSYYYEYIKVGNYPNYFREKNNDNIDISNEESDNNENYRFSPFLTKFDLNPYATVDWICWYLDFSYRQDSAIFSKMYVYKDNSTISTEEAPIFNISLLKNLKMVIRDANDNIVESYDIIGTKQYIPKEIFTKKGEWEKGKWEPFKDYGQYCQTYSPGLPVELAGRETGSIYYRTDRQFNTKDCIGYKEGIQGGIKAIPVGNNEYQISFLAFEDDFDIEQDYYIADDDEGNYYYIQHSDGTQKFDINFTNEDKILFLAREKIEEDFKDEGQLIWLTSREGPTTTIDGVDYFIKPCKYKQITVESSKKYLTNQNPFIMVVPEVIGNNGTTDNELFLNAAKFKVNNDDGSFDRPTLNGKGTNADLLYKYRSINKLIPLNYKYTYTQDYEKDWTEYEGKDGKFTIFKNNKGFRDSSAKLQTYSYGGVVKRIDQNRKSDIDNLYLANALTLKPTINLGSISVTDITVEDYDYQAEKIKEKEVSYAFGRDTRLIKWVDKIDRADGSSFQNVLDNLLRLYLITRYPLPDDDPGYDPDGTGARAYVMKEINFTTNTHLDTLFGEINKQFRLERDKDGELCLLNEILADINSDAYREYEELISVNNPIPKNEEIMTLIQDILDLIDYGKGRKYEWLTGIDVFGIKKTDIRVRLQNAIAAYENMLDGLDRLNLDAQDKTTLNKVVRRNWFLDRIMRNIANYLGFDFKFDNLRITDRELDEQDYIGQLNDIQGNEPLVIDTSSIKEDSYYGDGSGSGNELLNKIYYNDNIFIKTQKDYPSQDGITLNTNQYYHVIQGNQETYIDTDDYPEDDNGLDIAEITAVEVNLDNGGIGWKNPKGESVDKISFNMDNFNTILYRIEKETNNYLNADSITNLTTEEKIEIYQKANGFIDYLFHNYFHPDPGTPETKYYIAYPKRGINFRISSPQFYEESQLKIGQDVIIENAMDTALHEFSAESLHTDRMKDFFTRDVIISGHAPSGVYYYTIAEYYQYVFKLLNQKFYNQSAREAPVLVYENIFDKVGMTSINTNRSKKFIEAVKLFYTLKVYQEKGVSSELVDEVTRYMKGVKVFWHFEKTERAKLFECIHLLIGFLRLSEWIQTRYLLEEEFFNMRRRALQRRRVVNEGIAGNRYVIENFTAGEKYNLAISLGKHFEGEEPDENVIYGDYSTDYYDMILDEEAGVGAYTIDFETYALQKVNRKDDVCYYSVKFYKKDENGNLFKYSESNNGVFPYIEIGTLTENSDLAVEIKSNTEDYEGSENGFKAYNLIQNKSSIQRYTLADAEFIKLSSPLKSTINIQNDNDNYDAHYLIEFEDGTYNYYKETNGDYKRYYIELDEPDGLMVRTREYIPALNGEYFRCYCKVPGSGIGEDARYYETYFKITDFDINAFNSGYTEVSESDITYANNVGNKTYYYKYRKIGWHGFVYGYTDDFTKNGVAFEKKDGKYNIFANDKLGVDNDAKLKKYEKSDIFIEAEPNKIDTSLFDSTGTKAYRDEDGDYFVSSSYFNSSLFGIVKYKRNYGKYKLDKASSTPEFSLFKEGDYLTDLYVFTEDSKGGYVHVIAETSDPITPKWYQQWARKNNLNKNFREFDWEVDRETIYSTNNFFKQYDKKLDYDQYFSKWKDGHLGPWRKRYTRFTPQKVHVYEGYELSSDYIYYVRRVCEDGSDFYIPYKFTDYEFYDLAKRGREFKISTLNDEIVTITLGYDKDAGGYFLEDGASNNVDDYVYIRYRKWENTLEPEPTGLWKYGYCSVETIKEIFTGKQNTASQQHSNLAVMCRDGDNRNYFLGYWPESDAYAQPVGYIKYDNSSITLTDNLVMDQIYYRSSLANKPISQAEYQCNESQIFNTIELNYDVENKKFFNDYYGIDNITFDFLFSNSNKNQLVNYKNHLCTVTKIQTQIAKGETFYDDCYVLIFSQDKQEIYPRIFLDSNRQPFDDEEEKKLLNVHPVVDFRENSIELEWYSISQDPNIIKKFGSIAPNELDKKVIIADNSKGSNQRLKSLEELKANSNNLGIYVQYGPLYGAQYLDLGKQKNRYDKNFIPYQQIAENNIGTAGDNGFYIEISEVERANLLSLGYNDYRIVKALKYKATNTEYDNYCETGMIQQIRDSKWTRGATIYIIKEDGSRTPYWKYKKLDKKNQEQYYHYFVKPIKESVLNNYLLKVLNPVYRWELFDNIPEDNQDLIKTYSELPKQYYGYQYPGVTIPVYCTARQFRPFEAENDSNRIMYAMIPQDPKENIAEYSCWIKHEVPGVSDEGYFLISTVEDGNLYSWWRTKDIIDNSYKIFFWLKKDPFNWNDDIPSVVGYQPYRMDATMLEIARKCYNSLFIICQTLPEKSDKNTKGLDTLLIQDLAGTYKVGGVEYSYYKIGKDKKPLEPTRYTINNWGTMDPELKVYYRYHNGFNKDNYLDNYKKGWAYEGYTEKAWDKYLTDGTPPTENDIVFRTGTNQKMVKESKLFGWANEGNYRITTLETSPDRLIKYQFGDSSYTDEEIDEDEVYATYQEFYDALASIYSASVSGDNCIAVLDLLSYLIHPYVHEINNYQEMYVPYDPIKHRAETRYYRRSSIETPSENYDLCYYDGSYKLFRQRNENMVTLNKEILKDLRAAVCEYDYKADTFTIKADIENSIIDFDFSGETSTFELLIREEEYDPVTGEIEEPAIYERFLNVKAIVKNNYPLLEDVYQKVGTVFYTTSQDTVVIPFLDGYLFKDYNYTSKNGQIINDFKNNYATLEKWPSSDKDQKKIERALRAYYTYDVWNKQKALIGSYAVKMFEEIKDDNTAIKNFIGIIKDGDNNEIDYTVNFNNLNVGTIESNLRHSFSNDLVSKSFFAVKGNKEIELENITTEITIENEEQTTRKKGDLTVNGLCTAILNKATGRIASTNSFFKKFKQIDGDVQTEFQVLPTVAPDSTDLYITEYYIYDPEDPRSQSKATINYEYVGMFPITEGGFKKKYDESCPKIRTIKQKEQNYLNLLQSINETFKCWAKYKYAHEEDGSCKYIPKTVWINKEDSNDVIYKEPRPDLYDWYFKVDRKGKETYIKMNHKWRDTPVGMRPQVDDVLTLRGAEEITDEGVVYRIDGNVSYVCYYDTKNREFYFSRTTENGEVRTLLAPLNIKDCCSYNLKDEYFYYPEYKKYTMMVPEKSVVFKRYIGKNQYAGFKYGVNLNQIQRNVDSNQLSSKLIVKNSNNDVAKDGFCSIQRASLNPIKENFALNFDYFIHKGMLDYVEVIRDLYDLSYDDDPSSNGFPYSDSMGYYVRLAKINKDLDLIANRMADMNLTLDKVEAKYDTYSLLQQSAMEEISKLSLLLSDKYNIKLEGEWIFNRAKLKKLIRSVWSDPRDVIYEDKDEQGLVHTMFEYINIGEYNTIEVGEYNDQINNYLNQMDIFQTKYKKYTDLMEKYKKYKDEYEAQIAFLIARQKEMASQKERLNELFYKKYCGYIKEGSWTSEKYLDDNMYFLDALGVLRTSAFPKVSYTINTIDLSNLEGYEYLDFQIGDKTTVEDEEFFGLSQSGNPYQEEVIISQIVRSLDEPSQNKFTVQNYKTQFEDLFQRMAAATQSLQLNNGAYQVAASAFNGNGTINADILQRSLTENELVFNTSNSLQIGKSYIITTDIANNYQLKFAKGTLSSSSNGGEFVPIISKDGINANLLTGQIDVDKVVITSASNPNMTWDAAGITAYSYGEEGIDYTSFARFDQYGFYGIRNYKNTPDAKGANASFIPASINDVFEKARFGMTWDGFFIKSGNESERVLVGTDQDIRMSAKDAAGKWVDRLVIGKLTDEDGLDYYGFRVTDGAGRPTLDLDRLGNLTVSGTINARDGYIGKVTIQDGGLYHIDEETSVLMFSLDKYGKLIARNAEISGVLKTTVLEKDSIQSVGGTILVRPSYKIERIELEEITNNQNIVTERNYRVVVNQNIGYLLQAQILPNNDSISNNNYTLYRIVFEKEVNGEFYYLVDRESDEQIIFEEVDIYQDGILLDWGRIDNPTIAFSDDSFINLRIEQDENNSVWYLQSALDLPNEVSIYDPEQGIFYSILLGEKTEEYFILDNISGDLYYTFVSGYIENEEKSNEYYGYLSSQEIVELIKEDVNYNYYITIYPDNHSYNDRETAGFGYIDGFSEEDYLQEIEAGTVSFEKYRKVLNIDSIQNYFIVNNYEIISSLNFNSYRSLATFLGTARNCFIIEPIFSKQLGIGINATKNNGSNVPTESFSIFEGGNKNNELQAIPKLILGDLANKYFFNGQNFSENPQKDIKMKGYGLWASNVYLKGIISAIGGSIGPLKIEEDKGIYFGAPSKDSNFWMTQLGELYINDAIIKGHIEANSGNINGIQITTYYTDGEHYSSEPIDGYKPVDCITSCYNEQTRDGFIITNTGKIIANDIKLSGDIVANKFIKDGEEISAEKIVYYEQGSIKLYSDYSNNQYSGEKVCRYVLTRFGEQKEEIDIILDMNWGNNNSYYRTYYFKSGEDFVNLINNSNMDSMSYRYCTGEITDRSETYKFFTDVLTVQLDLWNKTLTFGSLYTTSLQDKLVNIHLKFTRIDPYEHANNE